jgi:hypothetical protein
MCRATLRTIIVLEPMSERAETEEMLEELVEMRCLCSYAISVALLNAGEQLCTITFFDGEPMSVTYDELVRECPSCRERLGLHRLLPRSRQQG